MTMSNAPMVGAKVLTAEGDELGTVSENVAGCFKVDAPMQFDYWLAADCVIGTTGDTVKLSFAKDDLGKMKQDGPGESHTGYHLHR